MHFMIRKERFLSFFFSSHLGLFLSRDFEEKNDNENTHDDAKVESERKRSQCDAFVFLRADNMR